ncbi:hypothetical protein [Sphingomonas aerolata]|uniref:hypothetical protein n=1 Tax=Sphingomonas aerolata TaxID=185951 RepID=UPI00141B53C0|nr:hypothetical protein [Sphingomonas aerolata]NII59765.1 hypothetical protein [Sphingomonas aerolata]
MNHLRHLTDLARLLADELAAADGAAFAMAKPQTIKVTNGHTATLGSVARTYARLRRKRNTMFGRSIFADPAWDLLLDLFAADAENRTVSIPSACIAALVPSTTALRCISRLESEGMVERLPDAADRRRSYLRLAPMTHEMVASWLLAYTQQHFADTHVAYAGESATPASQ